MEATVSIIPSHVAWKKDKLHRAEVAAQAQGNMGHSDSTATGSEDPSSSDVQPRNRQQVASVRPDEVARPRCLPRRPCGAKSNRHAAETQRPAQFEITEQTRDSVESWIKTAGLSPADFLFRGRVYASPHISTRQCARIVRRWIKSIGLNHTAFGTHTMRRTKASLIYRLTKRLRVVQLLLVIRSWKGHVRVLSAPARGQVAAARHAGHNHMSIHIVVAISVPRWRLGTFILTGRCTLSSRVTYGHEY